MNLTLSKYNINNKIHIMGNLCKRKMCLNRCTWNSLFVVVIWLEGRYLTDSILLYLSAKQPILSSLEFIQ